MKTVIRKKLSLIVHSPYLNILIGVVLLYSGSSEALLEIREVENVRIGAHHGIILFGLAHVLKAITEVFDGLAIIDEVAN